MPQHIEIEVPFVYSPEEVASTTGDPAFIRKFHADQGNADIEVGEWTPSDKGADKKERQIKFRVPIPIKLPDAVTSVIGSVEGTTCNTTEVKRTKPDGTVVIDSSVEVTGHRMAQYISTSTSWTYAPATIEFEGKSVPGTKLLISVDFEFNATYVGAVNGILERFMDSSFRYNFGLIIQRAKEWLNKNESIDAAKRQIGEKHFEADKAAMETNKGWFGGDLAYYYGGLKSDQPTEEKQSWGQWASSWATWASGTTEQQSPQ